jgi:hypothetical protein
MRTGMEPFFEFCNAVLYAAAQIRTEYRAWRDYQRNMPRTSQTDFAPILSAKQRGNA